MSQEILDEVKYISGNISDLEKAIEKNNNDREIKNIDNNLYRIKDDISDIKLNVEDSRETLIKAIHEISNSIFYVSLWTCLIFIILLVAVIHFW